MSSYTRCHDLPKRTKDISAPFLKVISAPIFRTLWPILSHFSQILQVILDPLTIPMFLFKESKAFFSFDNYRFWRYFLLLACPKLVTDTIM